jgi:hypothetical protein
MVINQFEVQLSYDSLTLWSCIFPTGRSICTNYNFLLEKSLIYFHGSWDFLLSTVNMFRL